jgi:hypothetical protein
MRKAKHKSHGHGAKASERFMHDPRVELSIHAHREPFKGRMRILADGPMLSKKEIKNELRKELRKAATPELARLNWLKMQVEKMDDSKARNKLLSQIDNAMEGSLVVSVKAPKKSEIKKEELVLAAATKSQSTPTFFIVLSEMLPIIPAIAEAVKYLRTRIKKLIRSFEKNFELSFGLSKG